MANTHGPAGMGMPVGKAPALQEGPASHQLVGEVMAYQGDDGSWSERTIPHTGTETRSRLLREAAVRNIAQWGQP